jgi:hypothetical protein
MKWIQTECRRCTETFRYMYLGNRGRRRLYCPDCKKLEIKDANAFTAAMVSEQRRMRREAAHA